MGFRYKAVLRRQHRSTARRPRAVAKARPVCHAPKRLPESVSFNGVKTSAASFAKTNALSFCAAQTQPKRSFNEDKTLMCALRTPTHTEHRLASRRPRRLPCCTSTIPIRPDPEPKWIPPRTRRTAAPYGNTAAASMSFMLRTAVFLFDGCRCGRGYLKTSGEDW